MTPRGRWTEDRYVPEPSVARFELVLVERIAARPCDGCGRPLGIGPRRLSRRCQYHPGCGAAQSAE